jgi:hypothetical protein
MEEIITWKDGIIGKWINAKGAFVLLTNTGFSGPVDKLAVMPWCLVPEITNPKHQVTNKFQITISKRVLGDCFCV